jgi:hypothetical protein
LKGSTSRNRTSIKIDLEKEKLKDIKHNLM